MPLELKTGHNQNFQFSHGAQLSLYILMMKMRYGSALVKSPAAMENTSLGAASGGILLYLNHKGSSAMHVSPTMPEIRSLMGHRNTVATYVKRASEARGVIVHPASKEFEKSERNDRIEILPVTPAELPECIGQSYQCYRCYSNKECSVYARSEMTFPNNPNTYHPDVVGQLTGHLTDADAQYFMEWDRMIDLEAKEANQNITQHWLIPAVEREKLTGLCISSLEWDTEFVDSTPRNDARTTLRFFRTNAMSMTAGSQMSSRNHSGLSSLKIESGHHVVVSTDGCMYSSKNKLRPRFRRHKMHIVRGTVTAVSEHSICVLTSIGESLQLKEIVSMWTQNQPSNDDVRGCTTVLHETVCHFRMDKDEIMSGTGTLRQNLVKLFTADVPPASPNNNSQKERTNDMPPYLKQRLSRLRELVVHLNPPVFNSSWAASMFTADESCTANRHFIKGCNLDDLFFEYSCNLNTDQQAAVTKIVTAQDYTLVQGMPGTGKTSMISFVTRLLAARGKRILITSYTHAAVDNLLMKLMDAGVNENGTLLRIGPKTTCHPSVQCILASSLALEVDKASGSKDDLPSARSLKQVTSKARIVGVTALSATRSPLLLGQHFDVVICDEAGQLTQPASLGALMSADTFVLVGDHMQLPPLVTSSAAEQAGYGVSMMKRLADAFVSSVAQLTLQYRMHGDIVDLCNEIVYKGKLQCANESIKTDLLKLEKYPINLPKPRRRPLAPVISDATIKTHWLAPIINPSKPVVFVDTDNIRRLNHKTSNQNQSTSVGTFIGLERSLSRRGTGGNVVNEVEVALVKHSVNALLACGLKPNEVGVICPLRSQIRLLDEDMYLSGMKNNGLEVSTIDRYQGRDKHAIIISFVRSNEEGNAGRLLGDRRRINVAVSRAKRKLIMIGSAATLKQGSSVLSSMLDLLRRRGWIESLPTNAHKVYDIA
uniref:DNA replication ATP-dependent helicase/nuclease n=1 Tax=Leptocylindrus danicus TaxID=163516 RepID=A0A7S2K300_9STRA